ncbi:hypothetical protein [Burkholderia sp. BCC0044]|nr:hypothetical protein [Burkholderia sp. BCC0044]
MMIRTSLPMIGNALDVPSMTGRARALLVKIVSADAPARHVSNAATR